MLRRDLLLSILRSGCVAGALSRCFGASGFWNKKQPSEWSAEEVERLKINSPWTKKVALHITGANAKPASMDSGGSRGTFGGMRGADSNGLSMSRGKGNNGLDSEGHGGPEVIVRWDSAEPVFEGMKKSLPPAFQNNYAISVTNLPRSVLIVGVSAGGMSTDPAERRKESIQRLLAGTTLSAKGHEPRAAAFVVQSKDLGSLIFAFEKSGQPFSLDDHEILFRMELGAAKIEARFETKEMTFDGRLAL